MIRVSLGTAACIGLVKMRMDFPPTTAYLLHGESCLRDCSFCLQARSSKRQAGRLGRITWPPFPRTEVFAALQQASRNGLKRICLQAVREPAGQEVLCRLIAGIQKEALPLPLSVSVPISTPEEANSYFTAGADRLSIALDAASPQIYFRHKRGNFQQRLQLIFKCARRWEGRIGTHIICGLGETEEELIRLLAMMVREKVTAGLFAFVPLKGTALSGGAPPEPKSYRRVQAAHYLLRHGFITGGELAFRGGNLLSYGLAERELKHLLQGGAAFQTSGCSGCNRPYYNERPGGFIYNYPRPLTAAEVDSALALIL